MDFVKSLSSVTGYCISGELDRSHRWMVDWIGIVHSSVELGVGNLLSTILVVH